MSDFIDRQVILKYAEKKRQDALMMIEKKLQGALMTDDIRKEIRIMNAMDLLEKVVKSQPSAQPEPLTDEEQRIFLAAMGREEEVCKQVDAECIDYRESYEGSLVRTCHEIVRKVKGALWT